MFAAASPSRKRVLELAQHVAPTDCHVLIVGPTGVGKDVLAEDIHRHSRRAKHHFVAMNCAAIPTELFESEIFGHGRGAYTSATTAKTGLAEVADRGTLFLDEVGELPLGAQAKLLRFLSKGTFRPVGSIEERSADVRILSATNRNLRELRNEYFREDLFYRLSVVTIVVPPLEIEDIALLTRLIATQIAQREDVRLGLHEGSELATLAAQRAMPGGVRELRSVLERYFVFRDPRQTVEWSWNMASYVDPLATRMSGSNEMALEGELSGDAIRHLDDFVFLMSARSAESVRVLSHRLDRSLQTVYERLKKLGIKPHEVGDADSIDKAIDTVRRSLSQHRPSLLAILKGLLET